MGFGDYFSFHEFFVLRLDVQLFDAFELHLVVEALTHVSR